MTGAVVAPARALTIGFDRVPGAVAVLDGDGRFAYVNRAMCQTTGHAEAQLERLTLADLVLAEDGDRLAVGLAAANARADPSSGAPSNAPVEVRLLRPDGRTMSALVGCAALGGGVGGPYVVVQLTDVSEQARAVQELRRSNDELANFAFLAAHELKAPLQTMSGFAMLLERVHGPHLDAQAREFAGWIVDGAGRMDALLEDLLAYCSVDTSDPVLAEVALDDVLAGALGELETVVAARGALVEAGPLPVVVGDPVQLGQLVSNLLANAVKFVPDERVPEVRVWAERSADGWLVTVADNGIGVGDESTDRIFDMFHRLHPRERYKGTGIGLSVCKRIVERRGGTIWVEPNLAAGSRFRFSLPDAAPAAVPTASAWAGTGGRKEPDPDT